MTELNAYVAGCTDAIAPKWTVSKGKDGLVVAYSCPFCDEPQEFDVSTWNFEANRVDDYVARNLRDHVIRDCETPHHVIKIRTAQYSEETDSNVILFVASRAGRHLLKDYGSKLYHLPNDGLLAIAAGLEDDAVELMNRANKLRSLI